MKIPKLKLFQKIEVHWLDAVFDNNWQKIAKAMTKSSEADTYTLGYYLNHDKDILYIAHTKGEKMEHDMMPAQIPIGMIKKVKKIG